MLHRLSRSSGMLVLVAAVSGTGAFAAAPDDFAVKEAGGDKVFRLSEAKGQYVVVHFLLKTDCPICLRTTRDYAAKGNRIPGVTHVFLKPDAEDATVAWAEGLKPENPDAPPAPPIYLDPDAKLAKSFGIPDGYAFHGEIVHYPALVILDPNGNEVFRYVGKDTTDRYTFDRFATKMAELRREQVLEHCNVKDGEPALDGYDPVSYFKKGPEKGELGIAAEYAGQTYLFVSETNRDAFVVDPEKYLPEYGGWCATAMANGDKAEVDPRNYAIADGRLFLFYSGLVQNAKSAWHEDPESFIEKADKAWQEICAQSAGEVSPRSISW